MDQLIVLYLRKVARTNTDFFRYLYDEIDWNNRLIVIKGSKGVGKTTLIMQHIKRTFHDLKKALYVSLDHIWFSEHNLLEIAEYLYTHGGTHLFLDEVHKYKNWEQEVKNIYDFYPDLHIVVTGSSMLRLEMGVKGDLSRRYKMYNLRGLSFREFIKLEEGFDLQPLLLEEVLDNHELIATDISMKLKVIPCFDKYLRHGYYPFYREEGSGFEERLLQVIDTVVSTEIPAVANIEYSTTYKIKHFLSILSGRDSYTLNVRAMCAALDTTRNSFLKLLDLIDSAGIVRKIYQREGFGGLAKPEKILFDNSNIPYAFGKNNIGTARECFFASQVSKDYSIYLPSKGDFLIDDRFTVEVGGDGKRFNQIKDLKDSYVAADQIEIGAGSKIPLWLFGMLY